MKHRIAVGMTTVAVAAGMTFIGVGSASAAAKPSAACKASGSSTIKPGLTGTAQNQTSTLSGKLTNCTGSGGVKSGSFKGTLHAKNVNCGSLSKPNASFGSGTMNVTWNTKKTSTATVTVKTASPVGTFKLTGKITKGQFAGHKISGTFKADLKHLTGNCVTTPLTKIPFSGSSSVS
jgi:hypothetical protein